VISNDGARNCILLITYHFPPSAAVGGKRLANFAKCLPLFGWYPQVLTIEDRDIEHMDPESLREVEGINIQKVGVRPTVMARYAALKSRLRETRKNPSPPATGSKLRAGLVPAGREALSTRLKRYVLSFAVFPDRERGWIVPAVLAAVRRLRRHRTEWIMTSCPPYSVHLIGLAVKLITGVRWIADFRDPWMTTGSKRTYATCGMSIRIESWLEKKVVEKADLVLFNVERLRNAYRERYAHVPGGKFVFIPNGIDPRALEESAPVTKYERFTLSYTGSLYVGRSPEPVFQAISRLIKEGKTTPESIRIKLVGHCRNVDGIATDSLIRKYGLESSVEVRDPLPYTEAMEIVRRSQLALLFAPRLPYQIPAKVYDYLGAGVRILAIAEDGGTSDLIRNTGSGQAFPSEDVEGIKDFIYQEMTRRGSTYRSHAADLARFDVRRITEELASHLNRIAAMGTADARHS
jgi:glycosyltransferase involved in cell wall biosynthesis